jgi:hypothetical protein
MILSKNQNLIFCFILLLALVLRIIFIMYGTNPEMEDWSDMHGYLSIADQILEGKWEVYHFFQSIGYPLVIALFKKLTTHWSIGLGLAQAIISWLTLVLMFFLTKKTFGQKTAFISLVIGGAHLPWIALSGFALPETIFTFLLAICAFFALESYKTNKNYISLSCWALSFITAFWFKSTHVLWGPLFLIGLFFLQGRKALSGLVVVSGILLVGVGAHAYLTYSKVDKVQLSASSGGLNMVEGKCPEKKNTDVLGYSWISPLYHQLGMTQEKVWDLPFTDSSFFMTQGFECIKKNPFILIQSFESIPFLFFGNSTWPLNQSLSAPALRLYEQFFSLFLIVGFISLFMTIIRSDNYIAFFVWIIPILSLFLCVYIFKGEMRYRIPFDIWFIPCAVRGWSLLTK